MTTQSVASRRSVSACIGLSLSAAIIGLPYAAIAQEQVITLWHSMAARNGQALQTLVERFNEQNQGKVKVEAIFQGKYNDTLSKLKASIQSKQLPNLVQVNELGSRLIYDLKITVPFADVAKSVGFETNELLKGIADYYTIDGKLLSLPFNASAPMLYYNKTAMKEAGLDPEKPPQTLGELRTVAEKMTTRAGGTTQRYGHVSAVDGWLIEQLFARAEQQYCNNDNGRSNLATAVTWDTPTTRSIVSWWGAMVRDGIALNAGRNNNDAMSAFVSGRAATLLFTSANLRDIIRDSKFEVGIANYPSPAADKNGQVFNGGASIWIVAGHDKAREDASARFLGYLGSAQAQAYWAAETGYIPVNTKAGEIAELAEVTKAYPDFKKPALQLANVATTPASRGCFMGVMPQAREKFNEILESVILGSSTPERAIADGEKSIAGLIASYNKAIGQ